MAEKSDDQLSEKVSFDTALDRAGFGLYSYIMTCLTGVSVISFVCICYCSTIIVPTSACELETTISQQGLLASGPTVGSMIGGVVWGYLADTRGRRKMMLAALFGGVVFNLIASLSVNWVMLLIFQFIASSFGSGFYSMSMSLLSESVPVAKRNFVVLVVSSIFLLSQGLISGLAIPISPMSFSHYLPALDIYWNSWRTLLALYSVPSVITFIWMIFMLESPKFVYVKGDTQKALEILRKIHKVNHWRSKEEFTVTGIIEAEEQVAEKSSAKDQIVPLFTSPLLKYTIIITTLQAFKQVGAFLVWLPTIADQFVRIVQTGEGSNLTMCNIIEMDKPIDVDAVPCALDKISLLLVLGVGALTFLVNVVLTTVINKVGRRNMVIIVTGVCGVCGILINLVPNAYGSVVLFAIFSTGIVVVGFYTAITVAIYPTHLRALAIALPMTLGRIGTFASIQILNVMLANSCDAGFYLFACLFGSSAIIASFLPDDRRLQKPVNENKEENVETSDENEKL
ncbi:putative transporter svop-1 [Helicoverpa zea]|uniref:putative transporter svop-1 n=1 Tax=Helicoverpa zea TaxID=7113 RepID=UPI001F59E26C|nr:putative transporter svop-1 [Helicoverpa zea]